METKSYPLPKVVIPPFARFEICSLRVSPGSRLYPCGISIPVEVAAHLIVNDVRVGRNSQLISSGELPGELFSSENPPVYLQFDSLSGDLRFGLHVTNTLAAPLSFEGSIVCAVGEQPKGLLRAMGCVFPVMERTISALSPQVGFKPSRLYVPARVLDEFIVDQVMVEQYLDLGDVSTVPKAMLSRANLLAGGEISLAPCPIVAPGQGIFISVWNREPPASKIFKAALLGTIDLSDYHPTTTA